LAGLRIHRVHSIAYSIGYANKEKRQQHAFLSKTSIESRSAICIAFLTGSVRYAGELQVVNDDLCGDEMMLEFDDIRPYHDGEVRSILDRLLADNEFLDTVAKLKLPNAAGFAAKFARPVVRGRLAKEVAGIESVTGFQSLIEKYLARILNRTVEDLSCSGLDQLDNNQSYLFISNHRDIAMDPAFVNWVIYHAGFTTLRIAIGDNLLTKPFASDLMRLNKSFIVKRGLSNRREKLLAAKKLSAYIHYSVVQDNENVWLAQREGRAKDGLDGTNPALINMLAMSKQKEQSLADFIKESRIVPVSISYAYDPCDQSKAHELYEISMNGSYVKEQHEDVRSIARGITGYKQAVHVSFGEQLKGEYQSAEEIAEALDRQIEANYVLHPTNCFAYELLEKRSPKVLVGKDGVAFDQADWDQQRSQFRSHVSVCNERWRNILLNGYANPVYRRLGER